MNWDTYMRYCDLRSKLLDICLLHTDDLDAWQYWWNHYLRLNALCDKHDGRSLV